MLVIGLGHCALRHPVYFLWQLWLYSIESVDSFPVASDLQQLVVVLGGVGEVGGNSQAVQLRVLCV